MAALLTTFFGASVHLSLLLLAFLAFAFYLGVDLSAWWRHTTLAMPSEESVGPALT